MKFNGILSTKPPAIQSVAKKVRTLIQTEFPDLTETISGGKKVKMALYSYKKPTNVVCGIQLDDSYCRLFIHHFDKVNLQGLNLHGTGKHARHIRLTPDNASNLKPVKEVLAEVFQHAKNKDNSNK